MQHALLQIPRMSIWMRSSVNYALWSGAATVTSPPLPRQIHKGQDDPPAQGSIRAKIQTSKMKEVRV